MARLLGVPATFSQVLAYGLSALGLAMTASGKTDEIFRDDATCADPDPTGTPEGIAQGVEANRARNSREAPYEDSPRACPVSGTAAAPVGASTEEQLPKHDAKGPNQQRRQQQAGHGHQDVIGFAQHIDLRNQHRIVLHHCQLVGIRKARSGFTRRRTQLIRLFECADGKGHPPGWPDDFHSCTGEWRLTPVIEVRLPPATPKVQSFWDFMTYLAE